MSAAAKIAYSAVASPAHGGGGGGDPRDALFHSLVHALVQITKARRATHFSARDRVRTMDLSGRMLRSASRSPSSALRRRALTEVAAILEGEVAEWSVAERAFEEFTAALRDVARGIEGFPLSLLADEESDS